MQQSENTSEQPQLLKIPQVAQRLGVSRAMVYTLISQGLPVIRLNRSVRVSVSSLQKWIEEQERKQSREEMGNGPREEYSANRHFQIRNRA